MKRMVPLAAAVSLAVLFAVPGSAEAKRLGGGKSIGASSSAKVEAPSRKTGKDAADEATGKTGVSVSPVIRGAVAGAAGATAGRAIAAETRKGGGSESILEKIKAEQAAAEAKAKEEEKLRAEAEARRLAEEAAKEAERQRKEAEAETRRLAAEEARKEAKRQQEARRSKCVILSAMSDDEISYCKKVWAEPDL